MNIAAEQAIRAGLALAEEIRETQGLASAGVAVRVGISTSPVVTGEFSEEKAEAALALIGEAPQIANMLQTVAPRNAVLIAALTKELVGELFDCSAIREPLFSGTSERGPFWRALREARDTSSVRGHAAAGPIAFCRPGRGAERSA